MYNKVELCGVNTAELPVLSEQEKRQLLTRARAGDQSARQSMIEGNLRLVLSVVQRFAQPGSGILPPPELGVRLVPCDTVAGHCLLPAVPAQALRWTARGRQRTRHGLYAAFCDLPPPPPGWTLLVGSDVMEGS